MDKIDYSGYVNRVDLLTGGCRVRRSASPLRKGSTTREAWMVDVTEILNLVQPKKYDENVVCCCPMTTETLSG
jgi:hypothetical protein